MRAALRRKTTVANASGTTTLKVTRARCALSRNRATPTPTKVHMLTRAERRPFSMSDSNWSTSVVIRVMIRPAISRS